MSTEQLAAATIAIREGDLDELRALAEDHPGLGAMRTDGWPPPVWQAAAAGATAALEILLAASPGSAEVEASGMTAACVAIRSGHVDCLRLLARAAPEAMVYPGADGSPPACAAAFTGSAEAIRILAAADLSSLHVVDREGSGPAFLAAARGHTDALRAIADVAPSAIRVPNAAGLTPMEVAWNQAHTDCVDLLRELGEIDPADKWSCACQPGQACGPSAAVTLAPFSLDEELGESSS